MLAELRVENLGVIAELGIVLGPGMTAVTGETGAGKTLVVEAIELLLGARADTGLVRAGADEARVEARFEVDAEQLGRAARAEGLDLGPAGDGEVVLARVVPADGRSRAYVDGRLVPAGALGSLGRHLVELHGQHGHQALLTTAAQRHALDRFAGAEAGQALAAYRAARERVREIDEALAEVGGDTRERLREVELLRYQVDEIDAAAIDGPDEEERLGKEEALLADAAEHREAAEAAHGVVEGPGLDAVGSAFSALAGRDPFADAAERLRVLQDELATLGREIRVTAEAIEEDPERLEAVRERRRMLADLRRKYGDTLAEVEEFRHGAVARLEVLEAAEERAAHLESERVRVLDEARQAAERLTVARRAAADDLGRAVADVLRELAMPAAEVLVRVEPRRWDPSTLPEDGLDEVELLLAANPGEPARPLARVASGGELARTMLAARVVLSEAPPTLVFDEVDAGIGGEAGVAVGRKLGLVARAHQVLCVTHLAQVAAFGDAHVLVDKVETGGRTLARARPVDGAERVAELSRMLSGDTGDAARDHAEELLLAAARERGA